MRTPAGRTSTASVSLLAASAGVCLLVSFSNGAVASAAASETPNARTTERATDWPSAEILKRDPAHPLFDTRTIDGVLYVETIGRGFIPAEAIRTYRIDAYFSLPGDDVFMASVPVDIVDDLMYIESIEELFFSTRLEPE